MGDSTHYVIRGGVQGRERLRILARVMSASTSALFDRVGVHEGQSCLDAGCGGGDATLDLARRVGPGGHVVGIDIDLTKLELARAEAAAAGLRNIRFEQLDIRESALSERFDLVYARFLLSHLGNPAQAVEAFRGHLRPAGVAAVVYRLQWIFHVPGVSSLRAISRSVLRHCEKNEAAIRISGSVSRTC